MKKHLVIVLLCLLVTLPVFSAEAAAPPGQPEASIGLLDFSGTSFDLDFSEHLRLITGRGTSAVVTLTTAGGDVEFDAIDTADDGFTGLRAVQLVAVDGLWDPVYWPQPLWPYPEGITLELYYKGIQENDVLNYSQRVKAMFEEEFSLSGLALHWYHYERAPRIAHVKFYYPGDFISVSQEWFDRIPGHGLTLMMEEDEFNAAPVKGVSTLIAWDNGKSAFVPLFIGAYVKPNAIIVDQGEYNLSVNTITGHTGNIIADINSVGSLIQVKIPYIGNITSVNPPPDNLYPELTGVFDYGLKYRNHTLPNNNQSDIQITYNFNYSADTAFPAIQANYWIDPAPTALNFTYNTPVTFYITLENVGETDAYNVSALVPFPHNANSSTAINATLGIWLNFTLDPGNMTYYWDYDNRSLTDHAILEGSVDVLAPNETTAFYFIFTIPGVEDMANWTYVQEQTGINQTVLQDMKDNASAQMTADATYDYYGGWFSHDGAYVSTGPVIDYQDKAGHTYFSMANGFVSQVNDDQPILVATITLDDYSLLMDQQVNVNVSISNVGDLPASNIELELYHAYVGRAWRWTDFKSFEQDQITQIDDGDTWSKVYQRTARSFVGLHPIIGVARFTDDNGTRIETHTNLICAILYPIRAPKPDYPYPTPELNITKSITGLSGTLNPGDPVNIEVTIENIGNESTGLIIIDLLDANKFQLNVASIDISDPNGGIAGLPNAVTRSGVSLGVGVVFANATNLEPNNTVTLSYTMTVKPGSSGLVIIYPTIVTYYSAHPIEDPRNATTDEAAAGAGYVSLESIPITQGSSEKEYSWTGHSIGISLNLEVTNNILRLLPTAAVLVVAIIAVVVIIRKTNNNKTHLEP